MNKDSKMLAEAYDQVEDLRGWAKAGTDSAQIASGEITRLENKVAELSKAAAELSKAAAFAANAIDSITGEAGYEGLPEDKQEALHKALEMLDKVLSQQVGIR